MDRKTGESLPLRVVQSPRHDRIGPRSASWLGWGLWVLVVLVWGLVIGFLLANHELTTHELIKGIALWVPFWAFATVGAVILARRPGNRIDWLCWAIGFAITAGFLGSKQLWVVLADQGRSSAWALLPLLGTMAYLGTLLGLLPFLILLFPSGRLLSRRWRPVAWALGLVLGLYLTAVLLTPGRSPSASPTTPTTPSGWNRPKGCCGPSRPWPASPRPPWSWRRWPRWWCGSVAPGVTNASSSSGSPLLSSPSWSCSQGLVGWPSGWPRRWGHWWCSQ
jgi:hypothetical protein